MTTKHSITPPPELVEQWIDATKSPGCVDVHLSDWEQRLATQAAHWGADQELEACVEWLQKNFGDICDFPDKLRAARRPKPPSLKLRIAEAIVKGDKPVALSLLHEAMPDD